MRVSVTLCIGICLSILSVTISSSAQSSSKPYDAVDPLIGTDGGGNTFPGASMPFGMMQWSPDTNLDAWYIHSEKQIDGFSLTHISGAGCPLFGDFAVLPTTSALIASPGTSFAPYAAAFDHRDESAHPGYYAITLSNGVRVEITVSERAGIARFIFPEGAASRLLVNAGSSANTFSNNASRSGYGLYANGIHLSSTDGFAGFVEAGGFCGTDSHYKLYVTGHFDKPYTAASLWQNDSLIGAAKSARGKHTGAWFDFGSERQIVLKVGISYVSEAGALNNLEKEIPGWNFDQARVQARTAWSDLLDRTAVEGGTADQRAIFYTGLYHSFLSPTLFSDEDGQYMGFDDAVHSLRGSKQAAQYANFSDWDIYRNTVQLQALFDPARESDMMQSLVNDAAQSGWLPRWPAANDVTYVMGGDSPVILLSTCYAFGAQNFDVETALKYMVKAGTEPGSGPHNIAERPFLADYLKLGYVPAEKDSIDASRTLEFANADFAIAQFARNIGHSSEYEAFLKQSENWKNLLDPTTHWIRPRNSDGTWLAGFDPERSLPKRPDAPVSTDQFGFEEGNTYQYSFMIPFDYPGLIHAMGGDAAIEPRLDKFFSKLICWGEPCFNMANEPDFVTPYTYVFAGLPWKTQGVITRIEQQTFKTTPDGIPGNDDLGATSGVYVWNALGIYPAVPGIGGVVLGTPMFDKVTLRLAGGRKLLITKQGSGIYVQRVTLNGNAYTNSWLPLNKVQPGTTHLHFIMDAVPNKQRGSDIADRPPSFR
jgi:predicted alpha-1,2-mannosidase